MSVDDALGARIDIAMIGLFVVLAMVILNLLVMLWRERKEAKRFREALPEDWIHPSARRKVR